MTKKRAILYLRFSDIKQMGNTSIETQEKMARSACEVEQYEVIEVDKNEAISADKNKQTSRVADLLEFCKSRQGKFDVLMVYKLDRFARSQEQHHWLRGQLLRMGILLRSATEKIDESPSGKLVEGVLAAVNEYDNEVRRERAKIALWRRIEQGLYPWQPPTGYMKDPKRLATEKLTPHVPDKVCKDAVVDLFNQYSTGAVNKSSLAREYAKRTILNHKGVRLKFSKQTVDNILGNPYYAGLLRYHDGTLLPGRHEPLVSVQLFKKCQDIAAGKSNNTSVRQYANPKFPLRQFVRCGFCGGGLTGAVAKHKYAHYFCYNEKCNNFRKTIRTSTLETAFGQYLALVKPSEVLVERFKKRFIARYKQRAHEIRGEYLAKMNAVTQLQSDKDWVITQGRTGVFSPETFKEELAKAEQKITLAKMELTELHGEELDIDGLLAYADDFLRTLENTWIEAPFEQKLKLQRLIFPEKVLYQNGEFSNTKICPLFNAIEVLATAETTNVTPRGIEPRLQG